MVQTRSMCKNQIAVNNNKEKNKSKKKLGKKYDFEINEEARSIWMKEDYLIRHPPSPNAKVLPFELYFDAQDEWRQMSHLRKAPFINKVMEKIAKQSFDHHWFIDEKLL